MDPSCFRVEELEQSGIVACVDRLKQRWIARALAVAVGLARGLAENAERIPVGVLPTAAIAVPTATMTSEIWLMRKAPWRTMKLPHPSCETSEAAAVKAK